MFEQDYVMKLIKEMVRAILKLLFNIDTESPTVELLENKEEQETLENLLDMVDAGEINEAENRLYDLTSNTDVNSLPRHRAFPAQNAQPECLSGRPRGTGRSSLAKAHPNAQV